jgi:hypothetical protein
MTERKPDGTEPSDGAVSVSAADEPVAETQLQGEFDGNNPYRSFTSVPAVPLRFPIVITAHRPIMNVNPVARAKEH